MQSRCCWPPESVKAHSLSLFFTSSQSAAWVARCSTISSRPWRWPYDPLPERDVVVDRLRKRVRFLEHHADPAANFDRVDLRRVIS